MRPGWNVDPHVTHLAHYLDGYPLCWPMDAEGEHTSARAEADVTCPDCPLHLST